jgi:hypothetical protein
MKKKGGLLMVPIKGQALGVGIFGVNRCAMMLIGDHKIKAETTI